MTTFFACQNFSTLRIVETTPPSENPGYATALDRLLRTFEMDVRLGGADVVVLYKFRPDPEQDWDAHDLLVEGLQILYRTDVYLAARETNTAK